MALKHLIKEYFRHYEEGTTKKIFLWMLANHREEITILNKKTDEEAMRQILTYISKSLKDLWMRGILIREKRKNYIVYRLNKSHNDKKTR